jgi:predicted nucleic acid-binding protein
MNYLVDTNVVLDIALERYTFVEDASVVFRMNENRYIELYISASSITDLYFTIKKAKGHKIALSFLQDLIQVCCIAKVDESIIREAIKSGIKDFEDAVQVATAKGLHADGIITGNIKDFSKSGLKIFTPKEFASKYNQ